MPERAPKRKATPKGPNVEWAVDYRFDGTINVIATTAEEAQEKFDAMCANGIPRTLLTNGELTNDKPYRAES